MGKREEFISKKDEEVIVEAIQTSEKTSSGEIRVHIEATSKTPLKKRCQEIFQDLEMDQTELRNGVLFYLAVEDRKFYIFGDDGIHEKVPENFWESTKEVMQAHFKKGAFKEGLVEGILLAGEQLKTHFPHADDDINELSDEISRG